MASSSFWSGARNSSQQIDPLEALLGQVNSSQVAAQPEPSFAQSGQMLDPRAPVPPPSIKMVPQTPKGVKSKKASLSSRGIMTSPEAALAFAAPPAPRAVGARSAAQGVAKGTGLEIQDSDQNKSQNTYKTSQDQYLSDEDYRALYDSTAQTPAFRDQAAGVDRVEELLRMSADQPNQLDLSPLMALAEAHTGKKMGYVKPKNSGDRQAELLAYAEKLQDDRRDISKSIMDAIAKRKNGTFQDGRVAEQIVRFMDTAHDPMKDVKVGRSGAGNKLKTLTTGAIDKFTTGQEAIEFTERMVDAIKANKDVMGPGQGLLEYSPFTFGNKNIERAKEFQAQLGLHQQAVGKLFEGGVLRKEDEAKYNRLFSNIRSNPDVAEANMKRLASMLRTDVTRYMENLGKANYDTAGFKSDLQKFGKANAAHEAAPVTPNTPAKVAPTKRTKELKDMSQAELDAYEASLKGGK